MRTLDLVALFVIVCSLAATASAQQVGDKSAADSKQVIRGRKESHLLERKTYQDLFRLSAGSANRSAPC
jgi:hypothetical protein